MLAIAFHFGGWRGGDVANKLLDLRPHILVGRQAINNPTGIDVDVVLHHPGDA